jgi:hypothetical protein
MWTRYSRTDICVNVWVVNRVGMWTMNAYFDQLCRIYPSLDSMFVTQKTLQRLQLEVSLPADLIPDFDLLHQFRNLTTLIVYYEMSHFGAPLKMYQSLLRSRFRLRSFEATAPQIRPISIQALVDLLQSPVLHSLHSLHLSFPGAAEINVENRHVYEAFIIAVDELPDLEELHLWYYLFHLDWIQHFRKSQRLRAIDWAYFRFGPIKLVGHYDDDDLECALWDILAQSQNERCEVRLDCRDYDRYESHSSDGSDDGEDDEEEDDTEEYYNNEYEGYNDAEYTGFLDEDWDYDGDDYGVGGGDDGAS